MKQLSSKKIIGVLGAGQLALFLSLKAQDLGLRLLTLSASSEDPAGLKSSYKEAFPHPSVQKSSSKNKRAGASAQLNWVKGNPLNPKDLKAFLKKIDILTFESEFFPSDLIRKCKQKTRAAPSLKNLSSIQDRLLQKKLLARYGFPILDFKAWDNKKGLPALLKIRESWGAFVLKTRRGGYDGYGTFVAQNSSALVSLFESSKKPLKKRSQNALALPKSSFIAEPFLAFKRELALLSARNQKGQIIFFPLVESFQKNSVCLWVRGPVSHPKLPELKRKIKRFLTKIDYRGVIAFELFETESGLIVNELAPRVHNTGHYSLSALTEDQFSLHLKAVSNQDLKRPRLLSKEFAMLNLLGEGSPQPLFKSQSLIDQSRKLQQKGFHLYWYGKKESHPGRKMGHINCLGDQALQRLLKLKKHIKV